MLPLAYKTYRFFAYKMDISPRIGYTCSAYRAKIKPGYPSRTAGKHNHKHLIK